MSGVQVVHGSASPSVQRDLDEITDEELLRQLWQKADNYSERRRIRARMYKLREKRLREMVQNDEESLGTLATTDQGTFKIEKSEAEVTIANPQRRSSNIEINLQVRGDSVTTDSISMHNVKVGGVTVRGVGSQQPKRTPSDEDIINEKVEQTKKIRNDRFNKIISSYEQDPEETMVSVSKLTYSVQNNALAGDSYQSMKQKEVRDSHSPNRYDYSKRINDAKRDLGKTSIQGSSETQNISKKQPQYKNQQKDSTKKVSARKLSKETVATPVSKMSTKNVGKQTNNKVSTKSASDANNKSVTKEVSAKNEYNKLDSYLNYCSDPNDEIINEEEEVVKDEFGNVVKIIVQTLRKKDGMEYISRRIARTSKIVDNEKDINEILIGNPDHELVQHNVEEREESDGSKVKIIYETRRRPDGIEYQTKNILKTSKILYCDHPENLSYSEDDELIDKQETKEINEDGGEVLTVIETRIKTSGEKYTTKKVYKIFAENEITPSDNDVILDRQVTVETLPDGLDVKVITEKRKAQNGEEYTHKQVFNSRKMTLSEIEPLKGLPSLTSEDEIIDKKESNEMDEAGNIVKKCTEMRKKKDGSQYSFDYVIRNIKCTEKDIKDIPYKVCDSVEINTSVQDELVKEDINEELQDDGSTVKTIIERRKTNNGTEYLRHRIIHIPKLPEPDFQVASKDDEVLEEDINEDILDDGTKFRAVTERRRSSTTGLQYTLRKMSKVFNPTIHLFGVDEIIDENVTEEETADGVLTRTIIRRYQRPDDSVYTTHNVSKTYKNPILVTSDECTNDELVDRSYDVRETHDGFLIRTVMETRCRLDGVHYTVERQEKISKNKSSLQVSNSENDCLLTGSPGDTVISREQHEEPGDVGTIIKTVIEIRRRKDGTEYTNKAVIKTTQILVPQHETSYVIIKPDPKNASGKDFMPSLNDEIIYTRNKEEIDDKGRLINVIIETRKSSVTGEKYNLTKRVRITDVVMTDDGEKVLSKNIPKSETTNKKTNQCMQNYMNQSKSSYGTSSIKSNIITDRNRSVNRVKEEVRNRRMNSNFSNNKNRIEENKNLSSSTDDESKGDTMKRKTRNNTRINVNNKVTKIDSNTRNSTIKGKGFEPSVTNKKTTPIQSKKVKKSSTMNQKSSGSSSETSDSQSSDKANVARNAPLNKSPNSASSNVVNYNAKNKITGSDRIYHNKRNERKPLNTNKKDSLVSSDKIQDKDKNSSNYKRRSTNLRKSDDENCDTGHKYKNVSKSVGLKTDTKSSAREIDYSKSISHSDKTSDVKILTPKRNSLTNDKPLTSKSTSEKALNYVNMVKKRNSKGSIDVVDIPSSKSDFSKPVSTNKTSAIRDRYSKNETIDTRSTSKKDYKLDNSVLSQIIPDTPKLNTTKHSEMLSHKITSDEVIDNVSSKRSLFTNYSDVKTVEINPSKKERSPVTEPKIVPKYIAPMCEDERIHSADLSEMKSKDLNIASAKLVRDTMHSRESSPSKSISDFPRDEFNYRKSSFTEEVNGTDFIAQSKTKRMSSSSIESYSSLDRRSSFTKENSPSRFITGRPIDHGVNTNKIKKLERVNSNKKLLENSESSTDISLSVVQKIEMVSDLTVLQNMLNKAECYEERRIIRGRIRTAKKKNQSEQTTMEKPASDKYSFRTPSTLSPQIQRRSEQLTAKPADKPQSQNKEDRKYTKSTKESIPSVSSISKNFSEIGKKDEMRTSSHVSTVELKGHSVSGTKLDLSTNVTRSKIHTDEKLDKITAKQTIDTSKSHKILNSDRVTSTSNHSELQSQKGCSQKKDPNIKEQISVEKTTKSESKTQQFIEPLRHQRVSQQSEKYQSDVEKIISPYGVGPTDENGLPLFGLRALKRKNIPINSQNMEISNETQSKDILRDDFEQRNMKEVKFENKEAEDALEMDPDSLSEDECEKQNVRSKNFMNIVKLHESIVHEPTNVVESSSPPKQKLRQDFFAQEDKVDSKPYKTWDLESDLMTRSEVVENIIAKHETLNTSETAKVEKRLTGILKKSTTSPIPSKLTEKESISEDVEELNIRRNSSDIASDFCGTKDPRRTSYTEITLSSQSKASKKTKSELSDSFRQSTDKQRKTDKSETLSTTDKKKKHISSDVKTNEKIHIKESKNYSEKKTKIDGSVKTDVYKTFLTNRKHIDKLRPKSVSNTKPKISEILDKAAKKKYKCDKNVDIEKECRKRSTTKEEINISSDITKNKNKFDKHIDICPEAKMQEKSVLKGDNTIFTSSTIQGSTEECAKNIYTDKSQSIRNKKDRKRKTEENKTTILLKNKPEIEFDPNVDKNRQISKTLYVSQKIRKSTDSVTNNSNQSTKNMLSKLKDNSHQSSTNVRQEMAHSTKLVLDAQQNIDRKLRDKEQNVKEASNSVIKADTKLSPQQGRKSVKHIEENRKRSSGNINIKKHDESTAVEMIKSTKSTQIVNKKVDTNQIKSSGNINVIKGGPQNTTDQQITKSKKNYVTNVSECRRKSSENSKNVGISSKEVISVTETKAVVTESVTAKMKSSELVHDEKEYLNKKPVKKSEVLNVKEHKNTSIKLPVTENKQITKKSKCEEIITKFNKKPENNIINCDDNFNKANLILTESQITETGEIIGNKLKYSKFQSSSKKLSDENYSAIKLSQVKNESKLMLSNENAALSENNIKIKQVSSTDNKSHSKHEVISSEDIENENKIIETKNLKNSQINKQTSNIKISSEIISKEKKNLASNKQTCMDKKIKTEISDKSKINTSSMKTESYKIKANKNMASEISDSANQTVKTTKSTTLQDNNKNVNKNIPSYMQPISNKRRRSSPIKDAEELENILLNSYVYNKCTKKVPIAPVSYDYTYIIDKNSHTAGSNGDSCSVYFGPRDRPQILETKKRLSVTSDTISVTEETITDNLAENIKCNSTNDVNLSLINVNEAPSVTSERKTSTESNQFSDIIYQNFETDLKSEGISQNINKCEIKEGTMNYEILSQHDNETQNKNVQNSVYLTVPVEVTTQNEDMANTNCKKYIHCSEKELQQKYNYQVENIESNNSEIFKTQEKREKESFVDSSDTEKSDNKTDTFNIDFNKVYADRMDKYYNSSTKKSEKSEQVLNVNEQTSKVSSMEKSESYNYATQSIESTEQNDSYYFTIDGRSVSKPLSVHLPETMTKNIATSAYFSEGKANFERKNNEEESTNEREYTKKYDTSFTEGMTEEVAEMSDNKSFLDDKTKVTGISDVLSRMAATEAVEPETKVTTDDQARSLLNRFLGAQVLMTGVESMMAQSMPSQNRSPAAFGQKIVKPPTPSNAKSTVQQSAPDIINGVNINNVNDSFELNELLDSCEGYDERRRIRLRLKDVVAQEKASGDIIGLKKVTSTTRRIAGSKITTVNSSEGKGASAFNKFKKLDQSNTASGNKVDSPLFALTTSLNRSASGVKDMIMTWCKGRTRNYKGVNIENFSTSWNDGLAFCALIHHFYPDAFNFEELSPKNRRYNFELAFRTAKERADVYPLLDVEDMVVMQKPDWKCVFTYVQTLYKMLKDL